MGQEFELKYRCDQPTQAQILESFPGTWATISMETTYYDTPQADFSRKRWTLRRRFENGISICTLKTPAPNGSRGEWETPCQEITLALEQLCRLGAPRELLAYRQLIPVCGAKFTRRALQITLPEGKVELALDSGCLMGGNSQCPLRELEVELKEGSQQAAINFAGKLAATYHLIPEEKSKYRRALDLAKGEENHGI